MHGQLRISRITFALLLACGVSWARLSAAEIITQTIVVGYTPAARDIAEELSGDMVTHTQEIVAATNEVYERSGIIVRLELADVRFLDFDFENSPAFTSLGKVLRALYDPADGIVDELHVWRDEVDADLAILKTDSCGGGATACWSTCDHFKEILDIDVEGVDGAFAIAGSEVARCPDHRYSFAHEIGHLQGCAHQPGRGVVNPDTPYAQGFIGAGFRTVMATAGEDRVGIFSSPDAMWEGQATGTTEENDNVRAINESARRIASFKGPSELLLKARVSVKVVLDETGQRPGEGFFHEDAQIEEAIGSANELLATNGAAWRLELVEVGEVTVDTQPETCRDIALTLGRLAQEDPERYLWRDDAINVYIADATDCRGLCGCPASGFGTIGINNSAWSVSPAPLPESSLPGPSDLRLAAGYIWLHEIGHFFNLCHTQGCSSSIACGEDQNPASDPRDDDELADTLPDLECWRRDELAAWSFSASYNELSPDQQVRVDATALNIMSYHRELIFADDRALFTSGQLERMAVEMDAATGRRANVIIREGDGGAETRFIRADCNDNGKVDLSDAVCIIGWLFGGGKTPGCAAATNVNGDASSDLSDPVYLLTHLFADGAAPVDPYPTCGPATLEIDKELGCKTPPRACAALGAGLEAQGSDFGPRR